MRVWVGFTGLGTGTSGDERRNEILCSAEGGVFIDKLSGCHERNVFDLVSCHLRMLSYISNETR
jgi:hypothetical protein